MTSRHPPSWLLADYFLLPSFPPTTRSGNVVVAVVCHDWHKIAPGHNGEDEGDQEGGGDHTEEDVGPPELVDLGDNQGPDHTGHRAGGGEQA